MIIRKAWGRRRDHTRDWQRYLERTAIHRVRFGDRFCFDKAITPETFDGSVPAAGRRHVFNYRHSVRKRPANLSITHKFWLGYQTPVERFGGVK
jgi:hypothetical protein